MTCILSVIEYGCEIFHTSLSQYPSDDLDRLQKGHSAVSPDLSYAKDLLATKLDSLFDRREFLSKKLL